MPQPAHLERGHFWLIRHASYDMLDRGLGGRAEHAIDAAGREQAQAIARYLGERPIRAVLSSPVRRALQTARPLADRLQLCVTEAAELSEIDFADWTGRSFDELSDSRSWTAWNGFRSTAMVPGGEAMLDVQQRGVALMRRLAAAAPPGETALFSHGDVIKALLAHFLGVPLDLMHRIAIDPASLSRVVLHDDHVRVLGVNLPV